jgi:hypothetical protein
MIPIPDEIKVHSVLTDRPVFHKYNGECYIILKDCIISERGFFCFIADIFSGAHSYATEWSSISGEQMPPPHIMVEYIRKAIRSFGNDRDDAVQKFMEFMAHETSNCEETNF